MGLFVAVLLVGLAPPLAEADAATAQCRAVRAPVRIAGVPGASLYGELCFPAGRPPTTVQLLVHGATYNHNYFDWPLEPSRYSYVRRALAAGFATFTVDRLGAGRSTRPPSALVTLETGAAALHQVIRQLRNGRIGGRPFSRVVWVGHSFGSIYAWVEARMFRDVDAFVLTGALHVTKPSFALRAFQSLYPAALDPKFSRALLDPGYLTTRPGTRGPLFYHPPNADPAVIALDERLKDTVTATELAEGIPLASAPPPRTAPSRSIRVPTLLVVGDRDNIFCGPPDGLDCTEANVKRQEAPYYSPQARLQVAVIDQTGHDLQLHTTAPQSTDRILTWIRQTVR